MKEPTSKWKSQ